MVSDSINGKGLNWALRLIPWPGTPFYIYLDSLEAWLIFKQRPMFTAVGRYVNQRMSAVAKLMWEKRKLEIC